MTFSLMREGLNFKLLMSLIFIFCLSGYITPVHAMDVKKSVGENITINIGNNNMNNPITISEINRTQKEWGAGLVAIGKAYIDHKDYRQVAIDLIDKLYAYNYENGIVLFKQTKAKEVQFRSAKLAALSYFVGGNKAFSEDKGFALQPWCEVVFHNDQVYFHNDMAIVMGNYDFTDSKGKVTRVEYTFTYVKTNKGGA